MKIHVLVVVVAVVAGTGVNAFFDMDFFKQFNQGFDRINQRTRDHAHHLEANLRTAFSSYPRDVEPLEPLEPVEPLETLEPQGHEVGYLDPASEADDSFGHGMPGFPGQFFNMFGGSGVASRGPWWKGPNVCVDREEIDESKQKNDTNDAETDDQDGGGMFGSFEFSSCQQTNTRYTCTTKIRSHGIKKTFVVRYQCCHGYARVSGKPHCTQVNLKSVLETAADLGAKDFAELMTSHGLAEKLKEANMTLFVPTDQVWRDFMEKMQQENQVEFFVPGSNARRRRSNTGTTLREIVSGHMTRGMHDISEMDNEQILYSENNNSTLRINVYPYLHERITTVNCARLVDVDNYASDGIVHTVDRVVRPATKTLAELLEEDQQLETLRDLLAKAGLTEQLKEPGHVTLFAPTSAAFDKLPKATLTRLNEGHSCLTNVLRHHLLDHTLCSAAVTGRVSTYNQVGEVLHLHKQADDGKLFIEGVQIVVRDVLGTNGIIHVIDQVIVPESAKSVSEVLTQNNLTSFASLLEEAELTDSIDSMNNLTVFAPSDKALSSPAAKEQLDALRADKDKLRDVLLYHTAAVEVQSCDLSNDQKLKTNMKEQDVRINLYPSQPLFLGVRHRATTQCARLIAVDHKACGGVIHVVDRLMVPPTGSVMHLIDTDDNLTILRAIIKGTGLEKQLNETSPITFLAPIDSAFQVMEARELERLKTDKELASSVLKRHILPEALCCSGVTAMSWPFTRRAETLSGDSLNVRRDHDGNVHLGSAAVLDCDVMATNGLVHKVDRLMVPRSLSSQGVSFKSPTANRFGNPNLEVLLYGL